MTFSSQVKTELCALPVERDCCAMAEAYGLLLYGNRFDEEQIRLVTSHDALAQRIPMLFARGFGIELGAGVRQRTRTEFVIAQEAHRRVIFHALGYDYKYHLTYHLNRNVIEEDCCRTAFLRGMFLAAGTVASPDKKAHLEMTTSHQGLSREAMSLMLDMGLSPKLGERRGSALLYWKDEQGIRQFLSLLGAQQSAEALEQAKHQKELRNRVNRRVNCETANLIKASNAAAEQIVFIQRALDAHGEEIFTEAMRETVRLRLEHPDASLSELAALHDPPISKPGLNHRLKKIVLLAKQSECSEEKS
ncbi:MAG: DNA-binding protein WhiA [Butyricicoccaceae bacterium]